MDVGWIVLGLRVGPMLEIKGRGFMVVQSQRICRSMMVRKELRREVR